MRPLAGLILMLALLAPEARAEPKMDNVTGYFYDDYANSVGVLLSTDSSGVMRDAAAGAITLIGTWSPVPSCCAIAACSNNEDCNPLNGTPAACCGACQNGENCVPQSALSGYYSSVDIQPSSFNAWNLLLLEATELQVGQITASFVGYRADGTSQTFGPLTRLPATGLESPYNIGFSLAGVDAATFVKGRYVISMTAATTVKPRVTTAKVTFKPVPKVKVVLDTASTACSNTTITVKAQVSVNYTNANNFLLTMPVPAALLPPPASPLPSVRDANGNVVSFTQSSQLSFANASNGGLYHAGPGNLVLAPGVEVAPGTVYWYRNPQLAGTSFIESATFVVPQGLLNHTRYDFQSVVSATNMTASVTSNTVQVDVAPDVPNPFIRRDIGNIFLINGERYTYPSNDLVFTLTGYNYDHPGYSCGEAYYQAYVWDDLTPILGKIVGNPYDIGSGGQLSGPNGVTTWDGYQIPPNAVFWDLRTLAVGQWYFLSYKVKLDKYVGDGGTLVKGETINQCATIKTAYNRSQTSQSCQHFIADVPDRPTGAIALGNRIRGALSINAGGQDLPYSTAEYNERYSLAMYFGNSGVSALDNVGMMNRIPPEVTLDSVFVPPSANGVVYYYLGTAYTNPQTPPPLDANGYPAETNLWVTTPPANKKAVTWVYVFVPALGSPFFPNLVAAPQSVAAEIYVTVDQPSGACSQFLVNDYMVAYAFGYITPQMTVPTPTVGQPRVIPAGTTYTPTPMTDGPEWVEIRPRTPNLSGNVSLNLSPSTMVGSGTITLSGYFTNSQPNASPTGTLLDTTVVITIPTLSVNGQPAAPLAWAGSVSAPGADSVDMSQIGTTGQVKVFYKTVDAFAGRGISLSLSVPKGFKNGDTLSATMVANGRDAICGPTSGSRSATAVLRGDPAFYLTKSVDFAVAGAGSLLNYELTFANTGQAVMTNAWIVDRIPTPLDLVSLDKPPYVESVWFSNTPPPTLPSAISTDFTFTSTLITSNFTQASYGPADGNGVRPVIVPQSPQRPRWIAWKVVDPALNPPLLVTDQVRRVRFRTQVKQGITEGTIAANDEAGFADSLLQTIGLRAVTLMTNDPSLRPAVECGAAVLAGGESSEVMVDYYNDSANNDNKVVFDVNVGDHVFESFTHVWNSVSAGGRGQPDILHEDLTATTPGLHRFTIVTPADGRTGPPPSEPLGPLEGGTLIVRYHAGAQVASGTVLPLTVAGAAVNSSGTFDTFSRCQTLVSNPDIQVVKAIDQVDPPSNQVVTFTVFLKNVGAHWAPNVVLTDAIPSDFSYVPNSASIVSPGWTGTPTVSGNQLTWSNLTLTGARPPASVAAAGFMPGQSTVIVQFQAKVGNVGPNHPLQNCASATTTLTEDDTVPASDPTSDNRGCASARTPLPDLEITKSVQASALPGDLVTWTIGYRNLSRELAVGSYFVDAVPFIRSDAYPTAAAVTYSGFHGVDGEVPYFSAARRNGPVPSFNPDAPTSNGWSATPTRPVNWIAVKLPSTLEARSPTRTVTIDFVLIHPIGRFLPEAGSRFENCVDGSMGGVGSAADEDPNNNHACATVGTPGIDLALTATCDPSGAESGVRPGDSARYTLTVTNTGVTTAFGARLKPAPGLAMLNVATGSLVASATGPGGASIRLTNEAGDGRTSDVSWSQDSNGDWLLGSATLGASDYYQTVGIPSGGSVSLSFTATIDKATLSGAVVVNGGRVTPDYGLSYIEGVSEKESLLGNNEDTCDFTVWRPDLIIDKTVTLLKAPNGAVSTGPADGGDRLRYTLKVNNIGEGGAKATNVRIEDLLPAGTTWVGNVSGDLATGQVQYADSDFAWSSTPSPDGVSGIRAFWPGDLAVATVGYWELDSASDFAADGAGVFDGTTADEALGAVVPEIGGDGGLGCTSGETYTIPERPFSYTFNPASPQEEPSSFEEDAVDWSGYLGTMEATHPAKTGCCLEPGSRSEAICQQLSASWSAGMRGCDTQFAAALDSWSGCLCVNTEPGGYAACVSDCDLATCRTEVDRPQCQAEFDAAAALYPEASLENGCASEPPYWNVGEGAPEGLTSQIYDTCGGRHTQCVLDQNGRVCEREFQSDVRRRGDHGSAESHCQDANYYWPTYLDPFGWWHFGWGGGPNGGNLYSPDSAGRSQCQADYERDVQIWRDHPSTDNCQTANPEWHYPARYFYWWQPSAPYLPGPDPTALYDQVVTYNAEPCAYAHQNAYADCRASLPGAVDELAAAYSEGPWQACGSAPTYDCLDIIPQDAICDTSELCGGPAQAGTSGTYVSPVAPTADSKLAVRAWETLHAVNDFPPGALQISLREPDGTPIPGFTDLEPDASGQISLATLPAQYQRFKVEATLSADSLKCMQAGPLVELAASAFEGAVASSFFYPIEPVPALPAGGVFHVVPGGEADAMGTVAAVIDVASPSAVITTVPGLRAPAAASTHVDRAFDAGPDGTIAGPTNVIATSTSVFAPRPVAVVGTAMLVKSGGGYTVEQLPYTSFGATWGRDLVGRDAGDPLDGYFTRRVVASKDFVVGTVLTADTAAWTACNAALAEDCESTLAAGNAYYQNVVTCAGWYQCLENEQAKCERTSSTPWTCPTDLLATRYSGPCAARESDAGCSHDDTSAEWYDYAAQAAGFIDPPSLFGSCAPSTVWGRRPDGKENLTDGFAMVDSSTIGWWPRTSSWDFGSCDERVALDTRVAAFIRQGGSWRVSPFPDDPAKNVSARAGDMVLLDVTPDGSTVLAFSSGGGGQLVLWHGDPTGKWTAEIIEAGIGFPAGGDVTVNGGLSADGRTAWLGDTLGVPFGPTRAAGGSVEVLLHEIDKAVTSQRTAGIAAPGGGLWHLGTSGWARATLPQPVASSDLAVDPKPTVSTDVVEPYNSILTDKADTGAKPSVPVAFGDAATGTLVGFEAASGRIVRWVSGADGYTVEEMNLGDAGIEAAAGAVPLGLGSDGTVVGRFTYGQYDFAAKAADAGFGWWPTGAVQALHFEEGYGATAAALMPDGRVIGFYGPAKDVAGVPAMTAYGAYVYACGARGRPSLDTLALDYVPDASRTLSFDVAVKPQCQTDITNVATTSNDIEEITLANNRDEVTTDVNAVTLVVGVKTSKVAVGLDDHIVFTFSVKNAGWGVARDVFVDAEVPFEVDHDGDELTPPITMLALAPAPSGAPDIYPFADRTFDVLQPGETQTWQVETVVVSPEPNVVLTAGAATGCGTIQCDTQRVTASATSLTGSWPNVTVTKDGPDSVVVSTAGNTSTVTYGITVDSNGNDKADGVVLVDTLPPGAVYASASDGGVYDASAGTVTWTLGTMLKDTSRTVTVTLEVGGCEAVGTTLVNGASVTSTSLESNVLDNDTSVSKPVLIGPDGLLRLDVTVDQATVGQGGRLWYTVRYWNAGTGAVTGATLAAAIPGGTTYVPGTGTGGPAAGDGQLVWNLGTLALGASGSVAFAVDVGDAAVTGGLVSLAGAGACAVTATEPSAQVTPGRLVIAKRASATSACGTTTSELGWSIDVINQGATPVSNVVVRDTVPTGTSYVGGSITGLGANPAGAPNLEWQLGTLQPGRGVTVGYRTSVPNGAFSVVTNTATVQAAGVAITTSAPADVFVDCGTAVALTASMSSTCALASSELVVTLVARNNTSAAVTVDLAAQLPPALQFLSGVGASFDAARVTFAGVAVGPQATATRSFTVALAAGVPDGTRVAVVASLTSSAGLAASNEVVTIPTTCPAPTEPECQGVQCTSDGTCVYPAINNGVACSDDSFCTSGDLCQNGACVGAAVDCNDDEDCTRDSCVPSTGCVNDAAALNGKPCIDGNACTSGDVCSNGECQPGAARDCDDHNPCTTDSCDPATGCVYVNNTLPCDDGNACTDGDVCTDGSCHAGPPLVCADAGPTDNPCTDNSCDPQRGCVVVNNTNPCDDGAWCTQRDRCSQGECTGVQRSCDDGEECTSDSCDEAHDTCAYTDLTGPCDDDNLCTNGDTCTGGHCQGVEEPCGDGGQCPGWCNPLSGECFLFAADGTSCDDFNPCTVDEVCQAQGCSGGVPVVDLPCDDNDLCTDNDLCDASGACVGAPKVCDDENPCTLGDTCVAGECVFSPFDNKDCDDLDVCTFDYCDRETGDCVNELQPIEGVPDGDCDGVDDDCDGLTDEDYEVPTTCGKGACAGNTGVETCLGGIKVDSCDPFAGQTAERCDGIDNDCDGSIDNGFPDQECDQLVIYLVVEESPGVASGTARCFQMQPSGKVRCETDPADRTGYQLKIYPDLICPADQPQPQ